MISSSLYNMLHESRNTNCCTTFSTIDGVLCIACDGRAGAWSGGRRPPRRTKMNNGSSSSCRAGITQHGTTRPWCDALDFSLAIMPRSTDRLDVALQGFGRETRLLRLQERSLSLAERVRNVHIVGEGGGVRKQIIWGKLVNRQSGRDSKIGPWRQTPLETRKLFPPPYPPASRGGCQLGWRKVRRWHPLPNHSLVFSSSTNYGSGRRTRRRETLHVRRKWR